MKPHRPRLSLFARSTAAICLVALAPIASAQTPTAAPESRVARLTPQEREALLDAGSEESADRAQAQAMGGDYERRIHGEIGAMIGTGGARGVFGTAVIPLGETGVAVVSFENYRFGDRPDR